MENRAHALAAGLFIISLLIGIAFVGNEMAGKPPPRVNYVLVAESPVTVSGLNKQAHVRFRGVQVGVVKEIRISDDLRKILIDIEVDEARKLREGTYAELAPEGITGLAYVQLHYDTVEKPGAAKANGAERCSVVAGGKAGEVLAAGAELCLRSSQFDQLFDSAKRIAGGTETLVASVQKVLTEENRKTFAEALTNVKNLAAKLEVAAGRLPATIDRVDQVMSTDNRRNLAEALANLNKAVERLPKLSGEAEATFEKIRGLTDNLNKLADNWSETATDLRRDTLPRANALAEAVERGAERIGKLAYELERRPESVLWGRPPVKPGPGEAGFE